VSQRFRIDLSVYEKERIELNKLQALDYDKVANLNGGDKRHLPTYGQIGLGIRRIQKFLKDNKKWLRPYALFL
jgi:hypothetical protein